MLLYSIIMSFHPLFNVPKIIVSRKIHSWCNRCWNNTYLIIWKYSRNLKTWKIVIERNYPYLQFPFPISPQTSPLSLWPLSSPWTIAEKEYVFTLHVLQSQENKMLHNYPILALLFYYSLFLDSEISAIKNNRNTKRVRFRNVTEFTPPYPTLLPRCHSFSLGPTLLYPERSINDASYANHTVLET